MARLIQVIETEVKRGLGIERDAIRAVTQYWSPEGKLLAERDEWLEAKHREAAEPKA